MTTLVTAAEREVRELHDFFAAWYRGECDESAFAHPETSLAASFRMVAPDGEVRDRETVLAAVRNGRDSEVDRDPPFEIEIRELEHLRTVGDHHQLTYEEWQRRDGWTGRRSTALFGRGDAPNGVVWLDLHETLLDS